MSIYSHKYSPRRAQLQDTWTLIQIQIHTWTWTDRHVLQDMKKFLGKNCNSAMVSRRKPFPILAQNVKK